MSDWRARVRPVIEFVSPEGNTFTALWQKNKKPIEKKLGIFSYPKLNGAIVQDLGNSGTRYPLTVFFDGIDNDIESARFVSSFSESGTWQVNHPVDGILTLQPVSINQDINPTENGSYTLVETEWIQPVSDEVIKSTSELASEIDAGKIEVNTQASSQAQDVTQDLAGEQIAIKQATEKGQTAFQQNLKNIYEISSTAAAQVDAISAAITATITATTINTLSLAGQIQALIITPGLVVTDLGSKIDAYKKMVADIFNFSPTTTLKDDKNTVLIQESFLSGIIAATADMITIAEFDTKLQVLQTIEDILSLYNSIIDGLDDIMSNFSSEDFDLQYFSQSESFQSATQLLASIIAYLLRVSFNLKIEKTIILDQDKAPIRIVIEQYGELGENDILLDQFIESNNLKGNEILVIPGGKSVVVYV